MKSSKFGPMPLVLVVDDDASARLLVSSALQGSGINVVTAESGEEAREKIRSHDPACVVLDVVMPGMSGLDLCKLLRSEPEHRHLPILIMTSMDDLESINDAYAAGATDFSPKGISPRVLVERVRFMLRAKVDRDKLVMSEARLDAAQRIARLGHVQWNSDGVPVSVSPTLLGILRLEHDVAPTQAQLMAFVHPDDRGAVGAAMAAGASNGSTFSIEHRIVCADGTERTVVQDGRFANPDSKQRGGLLVTLQDVTEHRRAERRAHYLTYIDELTGLPNRTLLRETIQGLLTQGVSEHNGFAIFVLDLHEFRRFNESLGQAAGDQLLRSIAGRIQRAVRDNDLYARSVTEVPASSSDTVGRLGGDEFVLVANRVCNAEQARALAVRLRTQLHKAFELNGHTLHVKLKIGISLAPRDGLDTETLLNKASAAAAIVEDSADDGIQFYDNEFNARAKRRLTLEEELRKAVGTSQFELHYQPRIAIASGQIVGAEALIRWNHPELGRVNPDEFISLAEQSGLIEPLGEWILGEATRQLAQWHRNAVPCHFVSVNLSPLQMRNDRAMLKQVVDAIEKAGISPSELELEITEGMLIRQPQSAVRLCSVLRGMGVGIALDDFGTGYSALGYLRRFPVNAIKIDRSFVNDVASARESQAIVHSILALAHGLGMTTVAEGVENAEQAEFLFHAGCEQIQGYLFSRPLPVLEFERLAKGWQPSIARSTAANLQSRASGALAAR